MARNDGSWMGFLAMAFAVVGMTGVVGTYAAVVPLERMAAHDAVLDAALATRSAPDPAGALAALRPELGDSADAVLAGRGDLAARVVTERRRVRDQFTAESADIGFRLRLVICVFTAAGALFGALVLSVVRRSR